jgi:hypothetical protein
MPDHVPAQAPGAQRNFRFRFLHFVLAEKRLARCRCRCHGIWPVPFADRQQLDFGWIPSRSLASFANLPANLLKIFRNIHDSGPQKLKAWDATWKSLLARDALLFFANALGEPQPAAIQK